MTVTDISAHAPCCRTNRCVQVTAGCGRLHDRALLSLHPQHTTARAVCAAAQCGGYECTRVQSCKSHAPFPTCLRTPVHPNACLLVPISNQPHIQRALVRECLSPIPRPTQHRARTGLEHGAHGLTEQAISRAPQALPNTPHRPSPHRSPLCRLPSRHGQLAASA